MITVFTPSFADEADTNAQNLSVKEIVARLSPDKFRVVMLHQADPDPRIAARPNTRLLRWRRRGNTLRILAAMLARVPDIYFFPREGPLDAAFLAMRKQLRLRTALVTYVVSGGLYNAEPVRSTLLRNVRAADSVYANCVYLASLVQERCGVDCGVRYDGVDRRFFYAPGNDRPVGELTVLFAGSFRRYKRTDIVIRQAARWPNVKFRLLGMGEEERNLRNLAEELHCTNVIFAGHLSPAQVGDEMRRANIFFFPSLLEGHPQVLLQAAACGLPCVAKNIYRPEFVVEGKTGYLVESDADLSQRLDSLITRPELRESMGRAAAVHAQQFDWEHITLEWQQAFEGAVKRRRQR
jgi:glycosyltransferase involved in cell wall biosynthesis